MFSLRVSVQRTRRPSLRASQAISTPSTSSCFAPKPPPMSSLTMRTSPGSSPSIPATTILARCGVCVVNQSVRRPSSPSSAAAERGSSGAAAIRWLQIVSETTTSQPAKSSSSCSCEPARAAMFVPASGKSSVSSFSASSTVRTTGNGS